MAEETPVDTDFTEPEGTVTLVSPSGDEYRTHNAVEINNLMYGQGYKLKADDTTKAAQAAAGKPTDSSESSAENEVESASNLDVPASTPPSATTGASKAAAKATASKASTAGTPTPPSTT